MNTLKIGDKIPAFECLDNTGNVVNSDDLIGKKLIVFLFDFISINPAQRFSWFGFFGFLSF